MFFRRKSKQQDTDDKLLHSLDGRHIIYVVEKNPATYQEKVLGRNGVINIFHDKMTIVCSNDIVFDHPLEGLKCSDLMSLNGVTIRYKDKETGENMLLIAYYKYHRK